MKWLLLILLGLSTSFATDTLRTGGDSCLVIVDSTGKTIDKVCKSVSQVIKADVFQGISIGIGVPAITVNLQNGGIGFLNSIEPILISYNGLQYKWIRNSEVHNFSFWTTQLGLSLSKSDSGSFSIGASIVPWAIRMDGITLGLGLKWSASNFVTNLSKKDLSIILPVTYAVF